MQLVEVEYLDGKIKLEENEENTLAELVALLGTEENVFDEVTSNIRYRNKHPRVYRKAANEIQAMVAVEGDEGIEEGAKLYPRQVKSKKKNKDGTETPIYVSDIEYLRATYKTDPDLVTETITKFATSEPLYTKGERLGGGRIPQSCTDAANGLFALGDDKVESVIKVIEEQVPGYKVARDLDNSATPESLARGINALEKHTVKIAKAQKDALLAGIF